MSAAFDGVDDIITIPSLTLGNLISIAAWIKPITYGETAGGVIFQHGITGSNGNRVQFRVDDVAPAVNSLTFLSYRVTNAAIWRGPNSLVPLGQWQHLAVTYDMNVNGIQLYSNGLPVTAISVQAPTGAIGADGVDGSVGNNPQASRTFKGSIQTVAVWTRVLPPEAILRLYWEGPLAAIRGSKFWYTWGHTVTGQDYSGNGVVGTVTGPLFDADSPPRLSRAAA